MLKSDTFFQLDINTNLVVPKLIGDRPPPPPLILYIKITLQIWVAFLQFTDLYIAFFNNGHSHATASQKFG